MAGGFMGWLARTEDDSPANLKMALLMGSAVASYTIDGWGTSKLQTVYRDDVYARFRSLREMMMF
jgi:ribokinase